MRDVLPRSAILLLAAIISSGASASTNGLGQALFEWFMIWCGIPAMILGATGALVAKVGYKKSLGTLAGLMVIVAVVIGSLPAFVMLLIYSSFLHAISYKLTAFARWLLQQDDAAPYKKYITDAQGVPADRSRTAGEPGG